MAHVRLVMLARNEAEHLPAMADACRGLIDSWCVVVDRRTTDGTFALAPKVFDYAPGEAHWSDLTADTFDFAAARNEAMSLASEPGVYQLWLDPDTPPVGTLPSDLTAPVYIADVRDENGWAWQFPILVRSDVAVRWHLPAHEFLEISAPFGTWQRLDDVYLQRSGFGADDARIEWSIKKLREEIAAEAPFAPRAMFYIGQMLASTDRNEEALEAFIRRVGMSSNEEEQFFSFIRIGELLVQPTMLDLARASRAFLDAYGMRPGRSEPLFYLSHIANAAGNHEMALVFANQGLLNPPTSDVQFVMRWIEEWGLRLQWAIAAHHLGNPKAPGVIKELLAHEGIHDNWRIVLERYDALPLPKAEVAA